MSRRHSIHRTNTDKWSNGLFILSCGSYLSIALLLRVTLFPSPLFNLPASNVSRTFAASSKVAAAYGQASCHTAFPAALSIVGIVSFKRKILFHPHLPSIFPHPRHGHAGWYSYPLPPSRRASMGWQPKSRVEWNRHLSGRLNHATYSTSTGRVRPNPCHSGGGVPAGRHVLSPERVDGPREGRADDGPP